MNLFFFKKWVGEFSSKFFNISLPSQKIFVENLHLFKSKYFFVELATQTFWPGLSGNDLPLNEIDNKMDEKSIRPKHYRFEKMISGYYLGELTRLVLLDLSAKKLIFMDGIPKLLKQPYEFTTAHMSEIQK